MYKFEEGRQCLSKPVLLTMCHFHILLLFYSTVLTGPKMMTKTPGDEAWHGDVMIILNSDSYLHGAHSCVTRVECIYFNWQPATGHCEIVIGPGSTVPATDVKQGFNWIGLQ